MKFKVLRLVVLREQVVLIHAVLGSIHVLPGWAFMPVNARVIYWMSNRAGMGQGDSLVLLITHLKDTNNEESKSCKNMN